MCPVRSLVAGFWTRGLWYSIEILAGPIHCETSALGVVVRRNGQFGCFLCEGESGCQDKNHKGCDLHRSTFAVGLRQQRLRSEEHTSELQSPVHLVCRLLL